jgi:hypothetical protein
MPNPRSGLWWLAALVLVAGGALAYTIMMDKADPDAFARGMLVLCVAIALAGICVISATAHWWLKR